MMSRTIRYFKLLYIVAGILVSNEDICETVDQIQIPPRLMRQESKEKLQLHPSRKVYRSLELQELHQQKLSSCKWFQLFDVFGLSRLKNRLTPFFCTFNIWTIPNYLMDRCTGFIYKRFIINSDCDMIYNK